MKLEKLLDITSEFTIGTYQCKFALSGMELRVYDAGEYVTSIIDDRGNHNRLRLHIMVDNQPVYMNPVYYNICDIDIPYVGISENKFFEFVKNSQEDIIKIL